MVKLASDNTQTPDLSADYYRKDGWLNFVGDHDHPHLSIFPHPQTAGAWLRIAIPGKWGLNVQGWKLHIGAHPDDQQTLFNVLAPVLKRERASHKFLPIDIAATHNVGSGTTYNRNPQAYNAEGKACVIYPMDPTDLVRLARIVSGAIAAHNARVTAMDADTKARDEGAPDGYKPALIRPFPGKIPGELDLNISLYTFTRYGGFSGPMTEEPSGAKIFDPYTQGYIDDPRARTPYPAFSTDIPDQIRAVRVNRA
ncbi:MAG: hypothetical protein AAGL96_00305 [Pseudomonadota bacterium]